MVLIVALSEAVDLQDILARWDQDPTEPGLGLLFPPHAATVHPPVRTIRRQTLDPGHLLGVSWDCTAGAVEFRNGRATEETMHRIMRNAGEIVLFLVLSTAVTVSGPAYRYH